MMGDTFEDHCWRDLIPQDVLDLYSHYKRDLYVGPSPALLVIDLYELAYQGGPRPVGHVDELRRGAGSLDHRQSGRSRRSRDRSPG